MAEIFVASGQGLIAVIKPRIKAVRKAYCELSRIFCRNSISLSL